MRITFRAKIFLSLVLTVGVLLTGAFLAVDRTTAAKIDELIKAQVGQGEANFREQTKRIRENLDRDGGLLAGDSWVVSNYDNPEKIKDSAQVLFNEIELYGVTCELLVQTAEDRPIARCFAAPGKSLEARDIKSGDSYPESPLVREMIEQVARKSIEPIHAFLQDGDGLYQVAALPILDPGLKGVLVIGRRISREIADRIHALQPAADGAGFVVGERWVASGFDPTKPGQAQGDGTGWSVSLDPGQSTSFRSTIGGEPFHVALTAIHRKDAPRPIYTALCISLKGMTEFREKMRGRLFALAGLALTIALGLSMAIARGVSAPVRDLVEGTGRVSKGEYSHRILVRSRDELGDLANAFNQMAGDLATKEKIRGVLNKVVAKDVAEELLKGDLGLGGRLMRATLLFADIRGFTPMTQGMAPQDVVTMLNEYMTVMSREIFACKGIVDKYVGDEIIGVFGAPKPHGHDAFAALEAAQRMRDRLGELNESRRDRGEPSLAMGIGVHTGEVVAGCMGSEELLSYTCIGETVNLASRLCSNAKAGQILISEAALKEAGDKVEARALPPIQVKGFREPVAVFEVVHVEAGETARRRRS